MNRFILACLATICIVSCQRKYPEEKALDPKEKEHLLDANRAAVHSEASAINEFIARHGWTMQMTGSGLHYDLYEPGNGEQASSRSVLTLAYKVFLLDGTLCYEAGEQHPLKLVTGKGDQVSGLEEGLLMMHAGGRARFVLPNHLAYGLTGDQDKIPPASALYYEVHLIKTETPAEQK